MIHNRHLPLWLHRICNGVLGAALLVGIGSIWFGEPRGSWQHVLSRGLIWASVPVGIILAVLAHRLSIVEGVAGGDGYDELQKTTEDQKPRA
jgi:TRAP-type C4-dicarboxylate transport system permease small subunit